MLAQTVFPLRLKLPAASAIPDIRAGSGVLTCLCCAVLVVALQLAFVLGAQRRGTLPQRYAALAQWDSGWYRDIVERGYRFGPPERPPVGANLSFSPGYPVLTRLVRGVTGLPTRQALVLTAQLAAIGFWTYFFLLCRRLRIRKTTAGFAAIAVAVFPTSYYLMAGYTESLFLCCIMGMLYWSMSDWKHAWILAAAHGFGISFTRYAGGALLVLPLALAYSRGGFHAMTRPKVLFTAAATAAGVASFFAYVHFVIGGWHLPFAAAKAGWGTTPSLFHVFNPAIYMPALPKVYQGMPDPRQLGALFTPSFLVLLGALAAFDAVSSFRSGGFRSRLYWYAGAGALWFLYVQATGTDTNGSIRYLFPPFVLLALAAAHLSDHGRAPGWLTAAVQVIGPMAFALSVYLLRGYTAMFTAGGWVS